MLLEERQIKNKPIRLITTNNFNYNNLILNILHVINYI